MAHSNTTLAQLLSLVPRHVFDKLALIHHQGRKLRSMTRWKQFGAMVLAQLANRLSLRDIELGLEAAQGSLYHLGMTRVARSSLARVNEQQPYQLYQALFQSLYARCKTVAPRHGFRFKNKLISLDSSIIALSLNLCRWANYNGHKAAVKLHVGLDHDGMIPALVDLTRAERHDIVVARSVEFERGTIVVFDLGYTDYGWYKSLTDNGVFFVTRQRVNAVYGVIERCKGARKRGVTSDQIIELKGQRSRQMRLPRLRRVGYRDAETGHHYVFLTNHFGLSARTIADIYKARWEVELFFKAIKQHLKVKTFLGTRFNAILTQIWIAMCVFLLLAYLKFCSRSQRSVQQILRLLQLNIFIRRPLAELLNAHPPDPPPAPQQELRLAC